MRYDLAEISGQIRDPELMGKFKPLSFFILLEICAFLFRVNSDEVCASRSTSYAYPRVVSHRKILCTRYVSPAGSDANSGAEAAPWRTAQHAFDSVRPGETVCFRAGTYPMATGGRYSQTLNASGTATERITVTNYPGEVAILHGSTRVNGAYVTFLGTPSNAPELVFEGPDGPGTRLGLIDVMNTHDVTFDHVEIRKADYHAGLYQYNGYNIKVLGAYVHDNGIAGSNLDHGIYWDETKGRGNLIANCVIEENAAQGIALYAGASTSEPSQVTIVDNTIVDNGHYGIAVYGTRNIIVNNILANNGAVFHSPQLAIEHGTDHIVNSNILWSPTTSQRGIYSPSGQQVTHSIIRDPLFVDSAAHNYHLRGGSPAIAVGNPRYGRSADRDGLPRGSAPEIGAYKYAP